MKRHNLFLALCCMSILLFSINNVYGAGYLAGTLGTGGEAHSGSFGIEAGWLGQKFLLGIGIVGISTESDWEIKYSNPLGTYYEKYDEEEEGYGAVGISILKNYFVVATIGESDQTVTGKSCFSSGSCIEWDPEVVKRYFTYSGRLQYVYKNSGEASFIFGAGYHNRRGIIGIIGFAISF